MNPTTAATLKLNKMPGRKRRQEEKSSDVAKKQDSKEPAKMTVAELRKELSARGLDASGKKAELVPRLKEALKGTDEEDAGPSEKPPSTKKAKTESAGDFIIEFYTPRVRYMHSTIDLISVYRDRKRKRIT